MASILMPPTPPATPPRRTKRWDPVAILEILNPGRNNDFTCLGWAETQDRRCRLPPAAGGQPEVYQILEKLAYQVPDFEKMEKELSEAASAGLCGRWHQKPDKVGRQVRYVMRKWKTCITQTSEPIPKRMQVQQPRPRETCNSEESPSEEGQSKAILRRMKGLELENTTLRAAVQDLEQEKKRLRKALSQANEVHKDELDRQRGETDRLLEEQKQLEDERQRREQEERVRDAVKRETEDRQKNELHAKELEAEKRSKQAAERQRVDLELLRTNEKESMADRERALQTANQRVQEEMEEIRRQLEKEKENTQTLHRTLMQQQTRCTTLEEVLQRERIDFTNLTQLHERERENSQRQKVDLGKLKELNRLEQQQNHRLLLAFHSLRNGESRLLNDRNTARRELRRVYQDSEINHAPAETAWTRTTRRLYHLVFRRTQDH